MLYELMKFEFFFRMKKISTYIYFGIFFLFSFLAVLSMGGAFKDIVIRFNDGGQGNVFANAPYVIDALVRILSIFGLMITAGMMGNAAYRDFEQKTHNLYFSYPITKFGYMAGRFVGTILTLLFVFSSIGIGAMLATMMPFVDADKIGPFQLMAYVLPYIFAVIPNLVFSGAIFYTLALKVRKRLPVYVSSVGMLMGYLVGLNLASDVENKFIAAIIEPFGAIASGNITEYWTTAEKNSLLIPFSGDLLLNRLLWLGISFLILWFAGRKFKLSYLQSEGKKAVKEETSIEPDSPAVPRIQPVTKKVFSATLALKQFFYLVKMEFLGIVKNIYFLAIVLFGVAFVLLSGFQTIGRIFGTHTYPVTYQVLQITAGLFTLFVLIVVTFYSGELVWRERDKKFNQINDAMPVASWIPFTSKLSALMLVQVALCFIILICGLTIQIFKGYTHFELGLYFQALFSIRIINYLLFAVLAMFVQVLVHHKYMGHFIMVVYYIVSDFLPALGLEHLLFRYPEATIVRYSDMNGYGHFLGPYYYFKFYWIAMAILLAIVSHLFWVRGTDTTFKIRLRKIKGRFSRGPRILAAGALSLLLTLGSIIIYNTTILNDFETRAEGEEKRVSYEKDYKKYENIPQPRVTDVRVDVDIYPYQRRAVLRGSYVLTNKTPGPIKDIHITINPAVVINSMQLDGGSKITTEDKKRGYYIHELKQPLEPGQTTNLIFDVESRSKGFKNSGMETRIVYNGTFFNNRHVLPTIGYSASGELSDDDTRKKHGLEPKERMAKVDDMKARMNTYISNDSDWISFETTVSTSKDQIALSPGYLQKEWVEGDRRYFHYKMDKKILNFYAFISARYEVQKSTWNDVAIEVYYHKGHEYNVQRMIRGVKKSLDYFSKNFSPYQHSQVRILEFPRYASFAQSFPNTIPYSEALGFIAKVEHGDVDYPFEIVAHEMAHQWWAHQVIGGNVQGATVMSEVLSQYSALMVMRNEYEDKTVRKFLKYAMDRYLRGRSGEIKKEVPLMLDEGQGYLHYRKGIVVMNALQDYIGEEKINEALAKYIRDVAYQEPPYTNSIEFLKYLREAVPEHLQYTITDMFETITLYENKAVDATYKELEKGKYEVTMKVEAKKLRAGDQGKEKEIPVADWMDIGVLDKEGKVLYLEKHKIDANAMTFTVEVDAEPYKAGLDPHHKLIDRRRDDNTVKCKVVGKSE